METKTEVAPIIVYKSGTSLKIKICHKNARPMSDAARTMITVLVQSAGDSSDHKKVAEFSGAQRVLSSFVSLRYVHGASRDKPEQSKLSWMQVFQVLDNHNDDGEADPESMAKMRPLKIEGRLVTLVVESLKCTTPFLESILILRGMKV
ncbi:hypothetical protein HNY73_019885 [Argiope bruennichi]|uniref:Uncharacterized protein n=1 Tax=Argiope bruennichi TaxID=94029 RepID=A0A8T0E7J4_ARGBR|nr:hypothetical protein HNY73_019885 [Argiope bruennichi]